jgi:hypothetical protein
MRSVQRLHLYEIGTMNCSDISVFRVSGDSGGYYSLLPADDDWTILERLSSISREAGKNSVRLKYTKPTVDSDVQVSDCPFFAAHLLVLSKEAWQVLDPVIGQHAEYSHAYADGDELYIVRAHGLTRAIDVDRSIIKYFPSEPSRIMAISKYAFNANVIQGVPIFKDASIPMMEVYCSGQFKTLVESSRLRGFRFFPLQQ